MLKKLLSFYDKSILYSSLPEHPPEQHYLFFDEQEKYWVGIPKTDVSEKELTLLKTLFELIEISRPVPSAAAKNWHDFLYANGQLPTCRPETLFRFIHFQFKGTGIDQVELESALMGFFTDDIIIVWENQNSGVVIEEKKEISLSEKDLIAMSETLESDFYMKISFYIGKFYPLSKQIVSLFHQENEYFIFAQNSPVSSEIFTFERIFPAFLAQHLPMNLTERLQQLTAVFEEEMDMFSNIKTFLENNLNASVTAKKLYIHRNTLQYRIDKFTEKTEIQLKDFYGAFTVFLACMLFEYNNMK